MEFKMDDCFTSLSIILSALALTYSWKKDRKIRSQAYADKFRDAASKILSKIERLQTLSLSFYDRMQSAYVETSEILIENFNIEQARDYFWKELNKQKEQLNERIVNENIEGAYIDLYSYHQGMRSVFINTLSHIKKINNSYYNALLEYGQKAIFSFQDKSHNFHSAHLGNFLREISSDCQSKHDADLEHKIKPIQELLNELVNLSDDTIIKKKFPILHHTILKKAPVAKKCPDIEYRLN